MGKTLLGLLLVAVVLVSCADKRKMLVGTWQGVKLENRDIDSFFNKSQHYIDTIGKQSNAAVNMAVYGVTNMDSLRNILQAQFDTAKTMQMMAVTNTIFRFTEDSLAMLSYNGVVDTGHWYIDKDELVLADLHPENGGQRGNMTIVKLTDMVLQLKFKDDSNTTLVTFKRQGK